tara:strand:+ start:446 stop:835 length:390 start_codon:yes stop_codon:yes gene_type:complete
MKNNILLLLAIIALTSCSKDDPQGFIIGDWNLERMVEGGKDIATECTLKSTMIVGSDLVAKIYDVNFECESQNYTYPLVKLSESIFESLKEGSNDSNEFYTTFTINGGFTLRQTFSDPIGVNYYIWRRN